MAATWEDFVDFLHTVVDNSYKYNETDEDDAFYQILHDELKPFFQDESQEYYTVLGRIITNKRDQSVFLPKHSDFAKSFEKFLDNEGEGIRYSTVFKNRFFPRNANNYDEKTESFEILIANTPNEIKKQIKNPEDFIEDRIKSLCILPLAWEGRVAGVIISVSENINSYQPESLKLYEEISKFVSRVFKTRRDRNRGTVLLSLNKNLYDLSSHTELSLENKISNILDKCYEHLDLYMSTKNVIIYVFSDAYQQINSNIKPTYVKQRKSGEIFTELTCEILGKLGCVLKLSNQAIEYPNEKIRFRTKEDLDNVFEKYGIENTYQELNSLMIAPMRLTDESVNGVFIMYNENPYTYDESDYDFVNEISDQAAIVIDKLYTYKLYQASNEIYNNLIFLITEIAEQVFKPKLNEDQILKQTYLATQNIAIITPGNMYISIYKKEENLITFPIFYKEKEKIEMECRVFSEDSTEWGRTERMLNTKEHLLIKTKEESVRWYKEIGTDYMGEPLASWMGVPIIVEGEAIGVIVVFHPEIDNLYQEKHLEIFDTLAKFVGIAIENARYQERLTSSHKYIANTQEILTRTLTASDLAHRLNNLAGTIPIWIGEIEEILDKVPFDYRDDFKPNDYHDIQFCLGHISKDTDALLREVEKLKMSEEPREFNIIPMVEAIVQQLKTQHRQRIRDNKLKIEILNKFKQVNIETLYSSLSHAIYVLIDNAIDAVLEKGKGSINIHLKCFENDNKNWLEITIQDTGCGIAENIKGNIFEPYVSTKGFEHGYGLWRAKDVIEKLEGNISFESSCEGTTFTVLLAVNNYN